MRSLTSTILTAFSLAVNRTAHANNATVCSALSPYFSENKTQLLENPSRKPIASEQAFIDQANINLLNQYTNYGKWTEIVDIDNDGREDLLAINSQGTGGWHTTKLYHIDDAKTLKYKADINLGNHHVPFSIFRYQGKNYYSFSTGKTQDSRIIASIEKVNDTSFKRNIICQTQTTLKIFTECKHHACQTISNIIENPELNAPFINILWPQPSFPRGLEVFFINRWAKGDFDNTGNTSQIWRFVWDYKTFTPAEYMEADFLGLSDMPVTINESSEAMKTGILSSQENTRLRDVLAQHSILLTNKLGMPVSLPASAHFFLFTDKQNISYWAWEHEQEVEGPPLGDHLHIIKTQNQQSTYIGKLGFKRNYLFVPCKSNCTTLLSGGLE